jgi:hypothetical protein
MFVAGHNIGEISYPPLCSAQLLAYFKAAFDRALIFVKLENKQRETVVFRLRAKPPRHKSSLGGDEEWLPEFGIDSTPMIGLPPQLGFQIADTWPNIPKKKN